MRKRALIVSAIAMVVLGLILLAIDRDMTDTGGPGIIGLEVAGTQDRAQEILSEWGDDGTDAAKRSLWLDYAYILAYATFGVLAAAATRDLAERRGWRRMGAFGVAVVPFAAAAGAFDAIEDVGLLLVVNGHGGTLAPALAKACASLKFLLLGITIVYLVAGLVLRLRHRETEASEPR